ncbi:BTB/POZ domain-containing protein 6-B-like [Oculina patagonica]
MAVFDEKWQKAKASITERGIFMFNNELLSDVSLVVRAWSDEGEPKKNKMAIPAHKFVLTSCSPVFFAMFCGELAEKSDSVDLPDCEYEGVLEMLRYMYSGKAELNESNVVQVLYVAKKYILPSLATECVRFLKRRLNAYNVFWVLSYAQQYDEKVLVDQCWELIDRDTEDVVKSEEFATIDRSLLKEIIKRDTLTIQEVELFQAVDVWASKECERQGLTPDGNVKRKILGEDIVKAIRFPVMEDKDIVSFVLGSKILTSEEVFDIMKYLNSVPSSPVGFPGKQRVGTLLSCDRFDSVGVDTENAWGYNSDKKECIDLQVDRDTLLYGVRMFGNKNSDYVVILKIREAGLSALIPAPVSKSGMFSSTRKQNELTLAQFYGFDVMFDSPFLLRKGIRYCVSARIDGPAAMYGVDGAFEVQIMEGVTFTFLNCQEEDCGSTDNDVGQFAAFLFRPRK